MDWQVC